MINKNSLTSNWFNLVLLTLLQIILFIPALIGGLYNQYFWLPFQVTILFIGLILLAVRNRQVSSFTYSYLDLTGLGITIAYFLSVTGGVSLPGAVEEAVKVSTYYAFYLIISRLLKDTKNILALLKTFYHSGTVMLIITFCAAFGSINYQGAFFNGRMYSTLEYANTFAAYALCLWFIGNFLYSHYNNSISSIYYQIVNFLLLIAFFGAQSRGAFIVLILLLPCYILSIAKNKRLSSLITTSYHLILAYCWINFFFRADSGLHPNLYWGALLGISLSALLPHLLSSRFTKNWFTVGKVRAATAFLGILVVFGTVLYTQVYPSNSTHRVTQLQISSSEAQHRLIYYQDALKIFVDHPLLGSGGKGWNSLYQQYQAFAYTVADVHSFYLKVLVETGLLGFSVLVLHLLAVGYIIRRLLINTQNYTSDPLVWTMLFVLTTLLLHSFVDVDLSLPAVSLLYWCALGIIQCLTPQEFQFNLKLKWPTPYRIGTCLLTILLLVLSISQFTGMRLAASAQQDQDQNRPLQAIEKLTLSTAINPLCSNNWAALAETTMVEDKNNKNRPDSLRNSLEHINRAIALEPLNPDYQIIKGKILAMQGKVPMAVEAFELSTRLRPFGQKYIDLLAETYVKAGKDLLDSNPDQAQHYLLKGAAYEKKILKRMETVSPEHQKIQSPKIALKLTPTIVNSASEARQLLNQLGTN